MLDSMRDDFGRLVQETVMGSQGKFGAYGVPSEVKLARVDENLYKCKFTVLTLAMRESDRTALGVNAWHYLLEIFRRAMSHFASSMAVICQGNMARHP